MPDKTAQSEKTEQATQRNSSTDKMNVSLKDRTHWIFDMDGTLTLAIHDFEAIRQTLGLPSGQPILEAIAKRPASEAQALNQQLDALEHDIAREASIQPGAIDLLRTLQAQGKHIGILTRNGRDIADATLQAAGLAQFFSPEFIVSRDCCAAKPLPDGVHLLLERWQAEPEQAVMVGDFLYDLKAGHDAGVATVHMDVNGEFAWPELTTVGVTGLDELGTLLGS